MKIYGTLDDGKPHLGSGTEFPANPIVGAIFEKTGDAFGPYYWNGTAWKLILTDSVANELGYTPLNKAGDTMSGSLSMPKTSGTGTKIDGTFGWRALAGPSSSRRTGLNAPVLRTFIGDVDAYSYAVGDIGDANYQLPHDYVPGSDLYLHLHWGHNGTSISGSFIVNFYITYAKGYSQAAFSAQKIPVQTVSSLAIGTSPQYCHRTDELQITIASGSSTQIDTSTLEVGGLVMLKYVIDTIPSISGSAVSNTPYIFTTDLHYQSSNLATKNKSPSFYA